MGAFLQSEGKISLKYFYTLRPSVVGDVHCHSNLTSAIYILAARQKNVLYGLVLTMCLAELLPRVSLFLSLLFVPHINRLQSHWVCQWARTTSNVYAVSLLSRSCLCFLALAVVMTQAISGHKSHVYIFKSSGDFDSVTSILSN